MKNNDDDNNINKPHKETRNNIIRIFFTFLINVF